MKRNVIITIIFCFIFITGCIFEKDESKSNKENPSEKDYKIHCSYSVIINYTGNSNYSLNIPFPILFNNPERMSFIDDHNYSSIVYDNLKIVNGTVNFYIEKTQYGYSLNISSNDSIELLSLAYTNTAPFNVLSMQYDINNDNQMQSHFKNGKYWIRYSCSTNNIINLRIETGLEIEHGSSHNTKIKGIVNFTGWQLINGTDTAAVD